MLCKGMKPTGYQVDSLPPARSYTTPLAECFANVWNGIQCWQYTAVRNLRNSTCWMLCKHMKPTEYQVDSSPPSGAYTTPRADCFANVWNQQNTRLTVYRRQEPTQPHVRNALQTYETNRIPGWQFTAVKNLHNHRCGMLCTRMKPTEYLVHRLPPSGTDVLNALQTHETNRIPAWQFTAVRNLHNVKCGMLCTRMKPTKYLVDMLPPSGTYVLNAFQTYETNRIPGWQFTAIRNLHNVRCGMLCTRMKPTEYLVDRLPPSGTYVLNALQKYETIWIAGWQFTAVRNLHNVRCRMRCARMKLTE